MGGTQVREEEQRFLAYQGDANRRSHAWRYQSILTHLPAFRGRHLWEDLTDVYQHAYEHAQDSALFAAYDLARFQLEFWDFLRNQSLVLTHVYVYNHANAYLWILRLNDRQSSNVRHTKRVSGRIRKGKMVETQHAWLQ